MARGFINKRSLLIVIVKHSAPAVIQLRLPACSSSGNCGFLKRRKIFSGSLRDGKAEFCFVLLQKKIESIVSEVGSRRHVIFFELAEQ